MLWTGHYRPSRRRRSDRKFGLADVTVTRYRSRPMTIEMLNDEELAALHQWHRRRATECRQAERFDEALDHADRALDMQAARDLCQIRN